MLVGDFMFYLGIDIGKNTHVASLIDDEKNIIFKSFSFSNSTDGAKALLDMLEPFKDSLEIGLEATGHYWLSLYSFLFENNFSLHVINPIQTDGWRKGSEIRKKKNDTIDSILIADLIRYGDFLETSLSDENYLSLRSLSRFRSYQISTIGDLKRKVISLLDQVFPEYEKLFSDIFGKTSKEILLSLTSPSDFDNISAKKLKQILKNIRQKDFAKNKITELSKVAKSSFGVTFCLDSFSLQIKMLINQIDFIENQIKEIEVEISNIMNKINSPITSVPGIGNILGATILGEIGDISRFSNPSKLVAYAGIDSKVSQSGEYEASGLSITKRGSSHLRKALFQAALVAEFKDPVFQAFYRKKVSEGKHHFVATTAVARKLVHVLHAVLTKNEPYIIKEV